MSFKKKGQCFTAYAKVFKGKFNQIQFKIMALQAKIELETTVFDLNAWWKSCFSELLRPPLSCWTCTSPSTWLRGTRFVHPTPKRSSSNAWHELRGAWPLLGSEGSSDSALRVVKASPYADLHLTPAPGRPQALFAGQTHVVLTDVTRMC